MNKQKILNILTVVNFILLTTITVVGFLIFRQVTIDLLFKDAESPPKGSSSRPKN